MENSWTFDLIHKRNEIKLFLFTFFNEFKKRSMVIIWCHNLTHFQKTSILFRNIVFVTTKNTKSLHLLRDREIIDLKYMQIHFITLRTLSRWRINWVIWRTRKNNYKCEKDLIAFHLNTWSHALRSIVIEGVISRLTMRVIVSHDAIQFNSFQSISFSIYRKKRKKKKNFNNKVKEL